MAARTSPHSSIMDSVLQGASPNAMDIPSEKRAHLRTVSLHELQAGSVREQSLLLQTCIEDGFFYLDLTHPSFRQLLEGVDASFKVAESLFNYPSELKNLYDVDQISDLKLNGYKPKGRNIVTKDGKTDGFETWVVSVGISTSTTTNITERLLNLFLAATEWATPAYHGPFSAPPSHCQQSRYAWRSAKGTF